jgi:hypothetical protein
MRILDPDKESTIAFLLPNFPARQVQIHIDYCQKATIIDSGICPNTANGYRAVPGCSHAISVFKWPGMSGSGK